MRDIEQKIINKIIEMEPAKNNYYQNYSNQRYYQLVELFKKIMKESFGLTSLEFRNNSILQDYLKHTSDLRHGNFKLWLAIEHYYYALKLKCSDQDMRQENSQAINALSNIESILKHIYGNTYKKNKDGTILLRTNADEFHEIIRKVYSDNNEKLIKLFSLYIPAPRASFFGEQNLPQCILDRESNAAISITNIISRNKTNLDFIEQLAIKFQRLFRIKSRLREERHRVPEYFEEYFKISKTYSNPKAMAEQLLLDANIPYLPQKCSRKFAIRLYKIANQVKLFSTIRHLTSQDALVSIFDDAIYGRSTLYQFYMPFKEAAMDFRDVSNGDGNVICFGANDIHPNCIKTEGDTVEIVLNLEKVKDNPCMFFKQQDLGFDLGRNRTFILGGREFIFSHTSPLASHWDHKKSYFVLYDTPSRFILEHSDIYAYSSVPNASLISYNYKKMHQILILNFFRFIDNLVRKDHRSYKVSDKDEPYDSLIKLIYSELEKLDDEELLAFLEIVGKQLSDTMEFNFYGAYKLDFDSILSINTIKHLEYPEIVRPFKLNIPQFIESLQKGDLVLLKQARTYLPNLFKSYRFVNYLLSKKPADVVVKDLLKDQTQFILPFYMKKIQEMQRSPDNHRVIVSSDNSKDNTPNEKSTYSKDNTHSKVFTQCKGLHHLKYSKKSVKI